MSDLSTDKSVPAWARVIGFIGVPSAIAVFLVYSLVGGISDRLDTLTNSTNGLTKSTNDMIKEIQSERSANKVSLDNIWRATAADCVNTSQNEIERNRCLGWEPLIK